MVMLYLQTQTFEAFLLESAGSCGQAQTASWCTHLSMPWTSFFRPLPLSLQGVHAEELSAVLSLVPQAEKFAKFWICQAKVLAQSGPFDVLQLYREAVVAGAEVSGACQLHVFPASALEGFLKFQGPGFRIT